MERKILAKLCGATPANQFLSEILEKYVLHSSGCFTKNDIEALLSITTVNSLFSRFPLHPTRYQVIKNGTVDRDPPKHPAGGMDPEQMAIAYRNGQTIRLNSVHESVPSIRALCRSLAAECKCPVFANVYMTPAENPGFDPHYDDHDVFVIQCHGSKEWRIHDDYENQTELPLAGFEFDAAKYTPGQPSRSMTLSAGDTLYIPRGRMHSARAQASDSVHITLSLNWPTWNELLMDLIARNAISDVELRRSIISLSYDDLSDESDRMMSQLRLLLDSAINSKTVAESMQEILHAFEGAYFSEDPTDILKDPDATSWKTQERAA